MAVALNEWNRNTVVCGQYFPQKKRRISRINCVQRNLTINARPDLLKLERKLRVELDEILYQEELIWFKRSREDWIVSGDRSTHYYHIATTVKNNTTRIKALRNDEGLLIIDDLQVRNLIREYFVRLFTEDSGPISQESFHGHFPTVSEAEWEVINDPFTKVEVKHAMFDMPLCRFPGRMASLQVFTKNHGLRLAKY
ncbi:PREDICTED: uncharacterized protein LOC109157274 [Ipomoea nil]|uniref:uncharacterized protein LOC109157274 n=1 Tax=Ipomoea nil TaxID=35883 RepID=UPI0009016C61|nr:PREDICTED: uncharacterized protein LOC109157274 [Ipomoea nil]